MRQRGFTLIELLLSVSLISGILATTSIFYIAIVSSREKSAVITTVEESGARAIDELTNLLRSAQSITMPTPGISTSTLTFVTSTSSVAVVSLVGTSLTLTLDNNPPIVLTNPDVIITGFSVANQGTVGVSDSIKINFTATKIGTSGRDESNYTTIFETIVTTR